MAALREIRAHYDERNVRVYQAFCDEIADGALRQGSFIAPFKRGRVTWIKPSFLWMMDRSGWGTKPQQTRVLAIDISREGFEWALSHSCLSRYESEVYGSHDRWVAVKQDASVVIQWDPERSLQMKKLKHCAIQIGLSGEAVDHYIDEWIRNIADITPLCRQVGQLVELSRLGDAAILLPREIIYPLPPGIRQTIGASGEKIDREKPVSDG